MRTFPILVVLLILLGAAALWAAVDGESDEPTYPYSELLADAAAGRVERIIQDGTRLSVTFEGEREPRSVNVASESINVYAEVCAAAGHEIGECPIEYAAAGPNEAGQWVGLLVTALLPVLLIGAFIYFMMRQAQRGKPGT